MTVHHISTPLKQILLEGCTREQLEHVLAGMRQRDHVPGPLAVELADELAEILSAPPMVCDEGVIHNRPTIGWLIRRERRLRAATEPA